MNKLLIILLILISSLASHANQKVTLQLNWLNQFQFAGYYVAKEKGYYRDVGLDVEIKEYSQKTDLIKDLEDNKSSFAIGRSSLLIEKIKGKDIIALGAIFQDSPLMLLVRKDSNINKVEDLKNKRIMITGDARFSASILAMLNANGLKKEDFITQKHSFNLDDLITGKTDAMASYLSNEPILLKDLNIEYNVFHPKDFGFEFYSDILFTSSAFIKNNPTLTKKFYDASIKGWEYAFNNKAETAEIIFNKYNTQNKSLIHLIKEGEVLKSLAYAHDEALGHIDEKKLNNIINVFKILGLVQEDINTSDFIYDGNPHKTINFELTHHDKNIIILIIVFILIILSVIIYFIKRNHEINKLLQTVINSTDDIVFYKNNRFEYIGCNKSFQNILNKTEEQILGRTDFQLFKNEFAVKFREEDIELFTKNKIKIKKEWIQVGETQKLFHTKMIPFKNKKDKSKCILTISRDITDINEFQEKLKELAYHDELTKIYNRKAFNERIEEKFDLYHRYKTIFSICMYDIDDFKHINDTYGHDVGDKVLVEITNEIRFNIRKSDLIFRVGGEEFMIIFPKTKVYEAVLIVEKIRESIANKIIIENEKITISLGVTQILKEDTFSSLYERVDKLMYNSKHNGKNQTSKG